MASYLSASIDEHNVQVSLLVSSSVWLMTRSFRSQYISNVLRGRSCSSSWWNEVGHSILSRFRDPVKSTFCSKKRIGRHCPQGIRVLHKPVLTFAYLVWSVVSCPPPSAPLTPPLPGLQQHFCAAEVRYSSTFFSKPR